MSLIVRLWFKPEYRTNPKMGFVFLEASQLEFDDLMEAAERDFLVEGEILHSHQTETPNVRQIRARERIGFRGRAVERVETVNCTFLEAAGA